MKFIDTVDVKYDVSDEYESDDCCDIKQRYNVDPVLNEPGNNDTVNNDDPVNDDTITNDEPGNVDAKNDAETVDGGTDEEREHMPRYPLRDRGPPEHLKD